MRPYPLGEAAAAVLAGRHVLLVEDEIIIGIDLEAELEACGATVDGPIARLEAGIARASEGEFDVAILDINLAGEDVFPIAEILRRRNIPFLFHTGHGHRDELQRRFGQVPVCHKPLPLRQIVREVVSLLEA